MNWCLPVGVALGIGLMVFFRLVMVRYFLRNNGPKSLMLGLYSAGLEKQSSFWSAAFRAKEPIASLNVTRER